MSLNDKQLAFGFGKPQHAFSRKGAERSIFYTRKYGRVTDNAARQRPSPEPSWRTVLLDEANLPVRVVLFYGPGEQGFRRELGQSTGFHTGDNSKRGHRDVLLAFSDCANERVQKPGR